MDYMWVNKRMEMVSTKFIKKIPKTRIKKTLFFRSDSQGSF